MKHSIVLALILFCGIAAAQEKAPQTIAILPFENNSIVDKEKLDPLRKGLADMLTTEMSKVKALKVLERSKIQVVVEELNLGETELVDKSTTQKMGKLLGARVLLFGGFTNLFDDKLRIDIRIVRTETGEVLKAEEETGELREFLPMLQSLVKKVASELDVALSSDEEGQLAASADGKFNSYVLYAQGVELEDTAIKTERAGQKTEAAALYEKARQSFKRAWEELQTYEPAKKKMDDMAAKIAHLKKS
jgi:TolB-like protein